MESDPDVGEGTWQNLTLESDLVLLWSLTKFTLESVPYIEEGDWWNLTLESDPDVGIELDEPNENVRLLLKEEDDGKVGEPLQLVSLDDLGRRVV